MLQHSDTSSLKTIMQKGTGKVTEQHMGKVKGPGNNKAIRTSMRLQDMEKLAERQEYKQQIDNDILDDQNTGEASKKNYPIFSPPSQKGNKTTTAASNSAKSSDKLIRQDKECGKSNSGQGEPKDAETRENTNENTPVTMGRGGDRKEEQEPSFFDTPGNIMARTRASRGLQKEKGAPPSQDTLGTGNRETRSLGITPGMAALGMSSTGGKAPNSRGKSRIGAAPTGRDKFLRDTSKAASQAVLKTASPKKVRRQAAARAAAATDGDGWTTAKGGGSPSRAAARRDEQDGAAKGRFSVLDLTQRGTERRRRTGRGQCSGGGRGGRAGHVDPSRRRGGDDGHVLRRQQKGSIGRGLQRRNAWGTTAHAGLVRTACSMDRR